ncbi:putative pentatricopeptide repeat-containing protein At1g12700, mitochondrial isoform X2 [Argentina anserina]|uniref:putative pentatricopeptide repeat-containing protein At1g12700, mitochondrial isoform X2 n=1 Tax=Argentina anserina TaxID=57926 RepID=UPI00217637B9|nr:putative pentatricopeptide repeat-containing protein At1g12700, mitochondrial isoform X2 [Potentilla anserina]
MFSATKTKHGALTLSSFLFKHFTPFSPFSSKPNSNPTPNQIATIPKTPASHVSDPPAASAVASLCSLLSNQTATVDSLLGGFRQHLSSQLVLQILMNYKQLGRRRTLEFFTWAGFRMHFQFDDFVVEYMADFLARRKLFDDVKCLLLTVSLHKGRVSCRAVATCIRFLGREGRIKEALCVFEEMESRFGCRPDNLVYNNVLYVLCKEESSGHFIDFALAVFRRIESPDVYSYSNMLVGLCKFRRFEVAVEVFGEMCRAGVVPTRSAVNVLVGELCLLSAKEAAVARVRVKNVRRPFKILVPNVHEKSGAIQPAVGVFWEVYKLGLLPSTFVIIRLLSVLSQLGKTEEAVRVLKAVEGRKLSCVEEGYCIVMKGLCEHCCVEDASHLFGRMLSQGMKPKITIYNSIICMLCKLGNLDDAENVFKIMNKMRCLPDSCTYSALVHAYCEAGKWKAAYDLMIEMLGLGCSAPFHTYSLVNKLLRENNRMDLCFKLERKLETQILEKLCKDGRLEDAYEKMKSMIEKGFYPPVYARDAFKNAFRKCGKLNEAQDLLQTIHEMDHNEEKQLTVNEPIEKKYFSTNN